MSGYAQTSIVDRITPKHFIGQLMAEIDEIKEDDSELENDLRLDLYE